MGNPDICNVTDNSVFRKMIKPKFKIRSTYVLKLLLLKMIKSCSFTNIPILNTANKQSSSSQTRSLEKDTISGINKRYKNHPSIYLIKSKNRCLASTFFYKAVSKATQEKDIHTKKFKTKFEFFAVHLQKDINASISALKFPNDLK